jgi:hypothetical protein
MAVTSMTTAASMRCCCGVIVEEAAIEGSVTVMFWLPPQSMMPSAPPYCA